MKELTATEIKALETTVEGLINKYKHCKVNLIHPEGDKEGIWAVPADVESKAAYDDENSFDKEIRVRLLNRPLGWAVKDWGDEIIAKTRGTERPVAYEADNISDEM